MPVRAVIGRPPDAAAFHVGRCEPVTEVTGVAIRIPRPRMDGTLPSDRSLLKQVENNGENLLNKVENVNFRTISHIISINIFDCRMFLFFIYHRNAASLQRTDKKGKKQKTISDEH